MTPFPGTIKAVREPSSSGVSLVMASHSNTNTPHETKPITHLPPRLDLKACLQLLEQADCDLTVTGIAAGRQAVTLEKVNDVLENSSLGLDDRMRFKHALASHGIIVAGKRMGA